MADDPRDSLLSDLPEVTTPSGTDELYLDDGLDKRISVDNLLLAIKHVKKEIAFPLDGIGKGATAPTLTRLGNTLGYAFTIGDDGYMQFEIPTDWEEGTDIEIAIHIYTDDAWVETTNEDETQWQGLWSAIPEDGTEAVDAATHTGTLDSGDMAIPTVAKALQEIDLGAIPGASLAVDDVVCVKLSRIALDGGTNPANEPVLIHAEYEYMADKLGEVI